MASFISGSDDEGPTNGVVSHNSTSTTSSNDDHSKRRDATNVTCYRFGSVGQDTLICLWDITEDILKQSCAMFAKLQASAVTPSSQSATPKSRHQNNHHAMTANNLSNSNSLTSKDSGMIDGGSTSSVSVASNMQQPSSSTSTSLTQRLASLNFGDRNKSGEHRRNFSLPTRGSSAGTGFSGHARTSSGSGNIDLSTSSMSSLCSDDCIELGSAQCPRMNEVPLIEPLVVKKIAHERLTALVFREECLVTACQDGYVCTWARPGKMVR